MLCNIIYLIFRMTTGVYHPLTTNCSKFNSEIGLGLHTRGNQAWV